MNKYETIIIIDPNIEAESIESIIENVQNLISDNNGQITRIDRWGKRRLAYEVRGNREGFYVLINYMAGSQFIQRLSQYCGLTEEVIKYMTVRAEKLPETAIQPGKIDETPYRRAVVEEDEDDYEYEDDYEDDEE